LEKSNDQRLIVDVLATRAKMGPRSFAEVASRTLAKAVYMRFLHTRQTVSRQSPVNVKFGRNSGLFVIAAIPQIGKD
jgi:hypothetical protein